MIKRLFCVVFLLGSMQAYAVSSEADAASLINKAGRQRMLSQRIVKAYCQLGMGVVSDQGKLVLRESVTLFDQQLNELRGAATSPELKAAFAKEETEWQAFRALAIGPIDASNAAQLEAHSETLLAAAQELAQRFQEANGQPIGALVNLAGRQRMLSQRLAKLYMLKQWNIKTDHLDQSIAKTRADFVAAMSRLVNAPETTPDIRNELSLAQTQWIFFDAALRGVTDDSRAANNVATTSERILQVLDAVTQRYVTTH